MEGKDVTLPQIMEIAKLEVSTQRHLDRMQETAKVIYVQYGRSFKKSKSKPGKFQHHTANGSSAGSSGNPSKSGRKGKKVPLPTDICWTCCKGITLVIKETTRKLPQQQNTGKGGKKKTSQNDQYKIQP